jgi:hypothetical protein
LPSKPEKNMTPSTTIGVDWSAYVAGEAMSPTAPVWNTHAVRSEATFDVLIWSSVL